MRALRVVAIASIVCLACSDSTGLTLEGSPFMRARIDGRPFSLQEGDVLSWGWGGTLGGFLSVQGLPATLAPDSNEFIYIQSAPIMAQAPTRSTGAATSHPR